MAGLEYDRRSDTAGTEQAWLFPMVFYERDRHLALTPLFVRAHNKEEQVSHTVAAGLYLHRTPEFSRDNFLYLYDREYDATAQRSEYGLLFDSLRVEQTETAVAADVGYGLVLGVETRSGEDFDVNVLWARHAVSEETWHNSFAPLWWYDSEPEREFWALLPVLGMQSAGEKRGFMLLGGGALYYNSYNTERGDETHRVLLGAAYDEIRRPEKHFASRGSMWRLLWDEQTQTASDYERFSILKFVYTRTRKADRVRHSIMGLPVFEGSSSGA